jgi:hypothetical protein
MERDAKDYAIEHAHYAVGAAERLVFWYERALDGRHDADALRDLRRAFQRNTHEFRKRAVKAQDSNR